MHVAIAQIAPVWLDRIATLQKVVAAISEAGARRARLVVFGEAFVPGYPFWIEHIDAARFGDDLQKTLFAHYCAQAVVIARGDLDGVCTAARIKKIWVALGIVERAPDRGGHSLYCALVLIDDSGVIRNVHRKLVPTCEEHLVWAPGDGAGLRTFEIGPFTVGGLNCWENWMPTARRRTGAGFAWRTGGWMAEQHRRGSWRLLSGGVRNWTRPSSPAGCVDVEPHRGDAAQPSSRRTRVPAGIGTTPELALRQVAPASKGMSLRRSLWMTAACQ